MSVVDDDDDYLSDKFLINASANTTAKPTTYSQIRKEAQKKAQQKNEQNRHKSRRQLELESREEGLSKSLFERAKEEDSGPSGSSNKALSIMMKMGFKPGQSLGTVDHDQQDAGGPTPTTAQVSPSMGENTKNTSPAHPTVAHAKHKTEPLPIQEWAGPFFFCCGNSTSPKIIPQVERVSAWANEPVLPMLRSAWQKWQKWPKTWVIAISETEPETIIIIGERKED
jgi:hypothetical protein